jgi:hypothetical protein
MSYAVDNWQYMNQQEDIAGWKGMEIGSSNISEISVHCCMHPFIGIGAYISCHCNWTLFVSLLY